MPYMGRSRSLGTIHACYYCGLAATTVDHVVPRKLLTMLRALADEVITDEFLRSRLLLVHACRECNSALGSRYDETLLARKRRVRKWIAKRYQKYLEMPEWSPEELSRLGPGMRQNVRAGLARKRLTLARLHWNGGAGAGEQLPLTARGAESSSSSKRRGNYIAVPITE